MHNIKIAYSETAKESERGKIDIKNDEEIFSHTWRDILTTMEIVGNQFVIPNGMTPCAKKFPTKTDHLLKTF